MRRAKITANRTEENRLVAEAINTVADIEDETTYIGQETIFVGFLAQDDLLLSHIDGLVLMQLYPRSKLPEIGHGCNDIRRLVVEYYFRQPKCDYGYNV